MKLGFRLEFIFMQWQGDPVAIAAAVHDVYDALGDLVDLLADAGIPGLSDILDDEVQEAENDTDLDTTESTKKAML